MNYKNKYKEESVLGEEIGVQTLVRNDELAFRHSSRMTN